MENVFSTNEQMVLKILGRRKMTIAEIADDFVSDSTADLLELQNYVAGVVRRINRKCKTHHIEWVIEGKGGGRHGRTVWRARK